MQNITLHTKDGFDLDAHYYEGNNGIGIVFCHGLSVWKEFEEPSMRSAEILNTKGFSTLLFDFRANGKSSGKSEDDFTITGQLTDIDTAIKYLQKQGCHTIYLTGVSHSGGAASLYAARHGDTIKKLLLVNPSLDYERSISKHFLPSMDTLNKEGFVEISSRKFRIGKKLYEEMKTLFPYKELEKFTNELSIIHGDNDILVPHPLVVGFFENLSNPLKKFSLIVGGQHGFHEEPFTTQVTENIVNFFSTPSNEPHQ